MAIPPEGRGAVVAPTVPADREKQDLAFWSARVGGGEAVGPDRRVRRSSAQVEHAARSDHLSRASPQSLANGRRNAPSHPHAWSRGRWSSGADPELVAGRDIALNLQFRIPRKCGSIGMLRSMTLIPACPSATRGGVNLRRQLGPKLLDEVLAYLLSHDLAERLTVDVSTTCMPFALSSARLDASLSSFIFHCSRAASLPDSTKIFCSSGDSASNFALFMTSGPVVKACRVRVRCFCTSKNLALRMRVTGFSDRRPSPFRAL